MRLTRFNKLTNEYEYCLDNPNTTMVQDEIAGIQKLAEYENIDIDPKKLTKIKQALDVIKKKKGIFVNGLIKSKDLEEYNILCLNYGMTELLTYEEFNLLKDVLDE